MKRTVALVVCVAALVVAAYTGSHLSAKADAPTRPAPPKNTRIAVLNIRLVVKNYKKYLAYMEQIKKKQQKYSEDIKAKTDKQLELLKQAAATTDADKRQKLEKAARSLKRDVEKINESTLKELERRGMEEMVRVYREIRAAASRHAKANNIDLVLHFEGAAGKEEADSPALIKRTFDVGCSPLYWNASLDISQDVLKALNDAFDRSVRASSPR